MGRILSIVTIIFLIVISCDRTVSKNEFEGQFISSMETAALDVDGNEILFNVVYTFEFNPIKNQNCLVDSKNELNSMLIQPFIRSVIRDYIGNLDKKGIEAIDKKDLRDKINRELRNDNITLNSEKFVDCPLNIPMFAITRRN